MINSINILCTNKCNMTCSYCYRRYRKRLLTVSTRNIEDCLNEIKNSDINNIVLTGGEPTLSSDLIKYISYFNKKQLAVLTNGIKRIKNITEFNEIVVSLDGDNKVMLAQCGVNSNTWSKILNNIRFYIDIGSRVGISVVITKQNVNIFDLWIIDNPWLVHCEITLILVSEIVNDENICLKQEDLRKISTGIENILNAYNYHIRLHCNMITKRDFEDLYSIDYPEFFSPEFNTISKQYEYFDITFDSLNELEQNYFEISQNMQRQIELYLNDKEDDFLFDPYSLAEKLTMSI